MSERLSTQLGVAAAIVVSICMIALAEHATAQTFAANGCPQAGERPALATDAVVKNGQLPLGTCYNPNTLGIDESTEQTKSYLLSLPRTGSAADNSSILSLNSSFAICAANFLKAYQQQFGGNLTITSGYRSAAYDAAMCKNNPNCGSLENNPNPMGNHQKGLALDVQATNQTQMNEFARNNPQYGVCFPFSLGGVTGTGRADTVHMILAGIPGSEPQGTGCKGVTQACSGSGFNPNNIPPVTVSTSTVVAAPPQQTTAQNGGLSNTLSRMFAPPQPASYAQPSVLSPLSSPLTSTAQTSACSPQYICSNGTVYYQSSSCTTATFQICQYGCAGTVCAPAPANGTSSQPVSPTIPTSALGLLQQFLTPVPTASTSTATSAPVSLNSNIYTIVQGELGSQTQPTSSASSSFVGTSGYVQQTLTGNPGEATTYSNTTYSPLMSLFINLRVTLSSLLNYLQPFGGQIPTSSNVE